MEVWSMISVTLTLLLVAIMTCAGRVLNWVWFRPKRLERRLKQQGFSGQPYRFLFGDMKENAVLLEKAKSTPLSIEDNIVPRVAPLLHQTLTNYGNNSFVWVGPIPRVNIMDPEHIRDVLTRNYEILKPNTNPLVKLLASGLANYEREKWAKHRRIINPAFHVEKLKVMVPAFYESCHHMIGKWEKLASSNESIELDVWPHLQELTCDIISRTAFGSNYEEGKRIFDLLKELAVLTIQTIQSVYIPGWRFVPTKTNQRMKSIEREIRTSLHNIINRREKTMKAGEDRVDDLLGILLASNIDEIQEHGNNKNVGMSIEDVIEECKLFYFAGQETTSTLLLWTMVLLSKYRNWQAQAREEVLRVLGNSIPDFDSLNHLKVVAMILYEVLRLYPPVVVLGRAAHEDVKLGKLLLPAGALISLPTIFVHYDREFWGEDATEFNPERFSGGISKASSKQVSFFPFGWGPRICIGQNFALVEAKLALAMILQRFSWELSPSYTHAPHTVITLQPQHGAHLVLHRLVI